MLKPKIENPEDFQGEQNKNEEKVDNEQTEIEFLKSFIEHVEDHVDKYDSWFEISDDLPSCALEAEAAGIPKKKAKNTQAVYRNSVLQRLEIPIDDNWSDEHKELEIKIRDLIKQVAERLDNEV